MLWLLRGGRVAKAVAQVHHALIWVVPGAGRLAVRVVLHDGLVLWAYESVFALERRRPHSNLAKQASASDLSEDLLTVADQLRLELAVLLIIRFGLNLHYLFWSLLRSSS